MNILKLDSNKHLSITSSSFVQSLDDFELLRIYISQTILETDISNYSFRVNIINKENSGVVIDLINPVVYKSYYKYEIALPGEITSSAQELKVWIEFSKDSRSAQTNSVDIYVDKYKNIENYMTEQQKNTISDLTNRLSNAENYIEELKQGVVLLGKKEGE